MSTKWESLQWLLTLANSIKDAIDMLGKAKDALPKEVQQQMPKWFGWTLDDERIFNAVVAQLDKDIYRVVIKEFLFKCKDYERNRFINIVAGMEVVQNNTETVEVKFDKDGKKTSEKKTVTPNPFDNRKNFLESFARIILSPLPVGFAGDLDLAYEYCVGGRMIIPDPLHQKVLRVFSESAEQFKDSVLKSFGVNSLEELAVKLKDKVQKESAGITNSARSYREAARLRFEASKRGA